MKKRLFSFIMLAVLLLSLLPLTALAEEPETAEDAAHAPENAWGIPADDVIWYGFYDEGPVAWLVLDAGQTNMGTEGVFLLTRGLVDVHKVVYDEDSTLWEGSLAQEWCTNFAETAFSPAESALVPHTNKHEDGTYLYLLDWRDVDLKDEQVFFLSVIELEHYFGTYGGDNKTTIKKSSLEDYYWLRSPILYHDDYHGMVMQNGTVHDYLPNHHWSARPCMNLNLQDAVWVLPAEDAGQPGPVEAPERAEGEPLEWKLVVALEEHAFRAETVSAEDGRLTVQYTGADTGEQAMLSLLARDEEGAPLGLWRLERPTAAEGELELDPAALGLPEDARLYLFCEELNEAYRSNYASPLQELERKAPAPEAAEPESPETPQIPEENDGEESTGTIQLVTPDHEHGGSGREVGTAGKIIAAVLLGLLAVGLVSAAVRRQSIIPIVLLILLLLLAAIVDLRAGYGFFPGL